ncbi:hypothetical protein SD71_14085 [Cohnella kolymensis]|uniref:Phenylalanyl-tRNA synthetase subunit beta n=1 Tax=Cohnella kolymensis TaxID=1590652 RepID=A0ABR5A309_9BACL|nr:hypothetical protein [Cohnella kolymensis]KIL35424.1 hypothetical protein SD71_14085 [Cohnella kolymensis]
MKKWMITIVAVLAIGLIGYKVGTDYVSNKIMGQLQQDIVKPEDVEKLKNDPEIQKIIKDNFSEEEVKKVLPQLSIDTIQTKQDSSKNTQPYANKPAKTNKPEAANSPAKAGTKKEFPIKTVDEAKDMVMSKFSTGEVTKMANMAKDGLSTNEKANIKSNLQAKLTDDEYEALKIIALMEVMKKDAN